MADNTVYVVLPTLGMDKARLAIKSFFGRIPNKTFASPQPGVAILIYEGTNNVQDFISRTSELLVHSQKIDGAITVGAGDNPKVFV